MPLNHSASGAINRCKAGEWPISLPSAKMRRPAPLPYLSAGAVVEDGQHAAVIGNPVEAEVVPCVVRHERVDLHLVIGARAQADESGDDEIAEGRVVVVLAALDAAFRRIPCAVFP